jgi:hypothetical protein
MENQLVDQLVDTILQLKGLFEETKIQLKYETGLIYWVYIYKAEELVDKAIEAMDGETLQRRHEEPIKFPLG